MKSQAPFAGPLGNFSVTRPKKAGHRVQGERPRARGFAGETFVGIGWTNEGQLTVSPIWANAAG